MGDHSHFSASQLLNRTNRQKAWGLCIQLIIENQKLPTQTTHLHHYSHRQLLKSINSAQINFPNMYGYLCLRFAIQSFWQDADKLLEHVKGLPGVVEGMRIKQLEELMAIIQLQRLRWSILHSWIFPAYTNAYRLYKQSHNTHTQALLLW